MKHYRNKSIRCMVIQRISLIGLLSLLTAYPVLATPNLTDSEKTNTVARIKVSVGCKPAASFPAITKAEYLPDCIKMEFFHNVAEVSPHMVFYRGDGWNKVAKKGMNGVPETKKFIPTLIQASSDQTINVDSINKKHSSIINGSWRDLWKWYQNLFKLTEAELEDHFQVKDGITIKAGAVCLKANKAIAINHEDYKNCPVREIYFIKTILPQAGINTTAAAASEAVSPEQTENKPLTKLQNELTKLTEEKTDLTETNTQLSNDIEVLKNENKKLQDKVNDEGFLNSFIKNLKDNPVYGLIFLLVLIGILLIVYFVQKYLKSERIRKNTIEFASEEKQKLVQNYLDEKNIGEQGDVNGVIGSNALATEKIYTLFKYNKRYLSLDKNKIDPWRCWGEDKLLVTAIQLICRLEGIDNKLKCDGLWSKETEQAYQQLTERLYLNKFDEQEGDLNKKELDNNVAEHLNSAGSSNYDDKFDLIGQKISKLSEIIENLISSQSASYYSDYTLDGNQELIDIKNNTEDKFSKISDEITEINNTLKSLSGDNAKNIDYILSKNMQVNDNVKDIGVILNKTNQIEMYCKKIYNYSKLTNDFVVENKENIGQLVNNSKNTYEIICKIDVPNINNIPLKTSGLISLSLESEVDKILNKIDNKEKILSVFNQSKSRLFSDKTNIDFSSLENTPGISLFIHCERYIKHIQEEYKKLKDPKTTLDEYADFVLEQCLLSKLASNENLELLKEIAVTFAKNIHSKDFSKKQFIKHWHSAIADDRVFSSWFRVEFLLNHMLCPLFVLNEFDHPIFKIANAVSQINLTIREAAAEIDIFLHPLISPNCRFTKDYKKIEVASTDPLLFYRLRENEKNSQYLDRFLSDKNSDCIVDLQMLGYDELQDGQFVCSQPTIVVKRHQVIR